MTTHLILKLNELSEIDNEIEWLESKTNIGEMANSPLLQPCFWNGEAAIGVVFIQQCLSRSYTLGLLFLVHFSTLRCFDKTTDVFPTKILCFALHQRSSASCKCDRCWLMILAIVAKATQLLGRLVMQDLWVVCCFAAPVLEILWGSNKKKAKQSNVVSGPFHLLGQNYDALEISISF